MPFERVSPYHGVGTEVFLIIYGSQKLSSWNFSLGRPREMVWGGRKEEGSGWGTHVYLLQIHFDIWQN